MTRSCWAVFWRVPAFRKQFTGLGSQNKDQSPGKSSSQSGGSSATSETRTKERPEEEEELTRRLAQHHLREEIATTNTAATAATNTTTAFLQPENTEQSIIAGNLANFVSLPKFICREEWIASHGMGKGGGNSWCPMVLTCGGLVFEFFHLVNAFYESVAEHCTARTCGPLHLYQ